MSDTWFVIVNPTAGNGRAKNNWTKIENELLKQNIQFNYEFSKHKNHIIILVKEALYNGYKKIISVGGDGTLHHVVNSVMSQNVKDRSTIKIAVIPIGTGNDWARTYGIPKNIKKAVQLIKREYIYKQDIGKILFSKKITYFNNLAGIGFDGFVISKMHQFKKLGIFSYLIAALVSIISYKKIHICAEFDKIKINKPSLMFLIGLCKYSGGGMQLTKDVHTSDGLFDISYIEKITLLKILFNLVKLFNGTITDHPSVKNYKTSFIKIKYINNKPSFIQADGELLTPKNFSITLVPKAINFIVAEKS